MMLMFMTNGTSRFKGALQVRFYCCFSITFCSYNNFNVPFIKDLNRTSAHTTADDDINTMIRKEVRQESWFVSGISNGFTFDNFIIFGVKNHEPFAMSK